MDEAAGNRVKLKFAQRSLREIERGKREWLARRDKSPGLFEEELAEAFETIKTAPAFGSPTEIMSRGKVVRRVEMLKTKCQVYYRQDTLELVHIMSVWSGQRGKKPKLQ